MERVQNAWNIGLASWSVLAKDRELALIPVLSGLAAMIAFALVVGPGVLLLGGVEAAKDARGAVWLLTFMGAVLADLDDRASARRR